MTGSCRGKHLFFSLVLTRHEATCEKRLMADLAEKRGELFPVFLMRQDPDLLLRQILRNQSCSVQRAEEHPLSDG
jgi:hypothetical protein